MIFLYLSLHWTANFHLSIDILIFLDRSKLLPLLTSCKLLASKNAHISSPEGDNTFLSSKREWRSWISSIELSSKRSSSIDVGKFFKMTLHCFAIHFMTFISFSVESTDPEYARCPRDLRLFGGVAHNRKADNKAKDGFPLWWI